MSEKTEEIFEEPPAPKKKTRKPMSEEKKAQLLENLRKGREKAKANREAKKKEQEAQKEKRKPGRPKGAKNKKNDPKIIKKENGEEEVIYNTPRKSPTPARQQPFQFQNELDAFKNDMRHQLNEFKVGFAHTKAKEEELKRRELELILKEKEMKEKYEKALNPPKSPIVEKPPIIETEKTEKKGGLLFKEKKEEIHAEETPIPTPSKPIDIPPPKKNIQSLFTYANW